MLVFLWILTLSYLWTTVTGYEEIVESQGCHACRLLLTCRHLTSIIAILKVDFHPDHSSHIFEANIGFSNFSENGLIETIVSPPPFPPVHPRDVLNQRCSGLNHCSFIFSEDCPGSEFFGSGNISIQYACITEDRIHKYCNSVIHLAELHTKGLSEGYIRNPGYPRFYSGQTECKWKIIGQTNQRIRLTILDISLVVDRPGCSDILEIKDTGQVIYSTCYQDHPPSEVISGTESIEIVLSSSHKINPRRGVLIHYRAVGCPEINIPNDAYLVYRNNSLMIFSCCLGYQFPDTGTRIKSVGCHGAFWNSSLPNLHCQKSTTPNWNQTDVIKIFQSKINTGMDSDSILAPSLILVALFLVNAAVVFFIFKARKRQELIDVKDEELGSLSLSPVEIVET